MSDSGVEELGQLLDQSRGEFMHGSKLFGHVNYLRIHVLGVTAPNPVDEISLLLKEEFLFLLLLRL